MRKSKFIGIFVAATVGFLFSAQALAAPITSLSPMNLWHLVQNALVPNSPNWGLQIPSITSGCVQADASGNLSSTGVNCGTGGGGGSDVNWTFFNGSGIRPATTSNQVLIGASSTSTSAQLEVHGGIFANASSTIGGGGTQSGLTIAGNSTTSRDAYFAGNVGIGSTAGTHALTFTAPVATYSTSVSVGGAANLTFSNANAGLYLYTNNTSSDGALLSIDCNTTTMSTQCLRLQGSATNQSTLNIQGGPDGLGVVKASALLAGTNNSSIFSADATTNSFNGQAYFAKCNAGTSTPCFNALNGSSNTLWRLDGNGNATTTGLSQFTGGFLSFASSTVGGSTRTTGLTIDGGSTTTGNAYFNGILTGGNIATFAAKTAGIQDQYIQIRNVTSGNGYLGIASSSASIPFSTGSLLLQAGGSKAMAFVVGSDTYNGKAPAMFIDTSGMVGIASTSPYAQLSVTNTGSSPSFLVEDSTSPDATPFVIDASGNVGIQNPSPTYALDVTGTARVMSGNVYVQNSDGTDGGVEIFQTSGRHWWIGTLDNAGNDKFTLSYGGSINTNNVLTADGTNVGIKNTAPSYTLDVGGYINTDQYSGYKQNGNTILYASTTNHSLAIGSASAAAWMQATSTSFGTTIIGDSAGGYTPTSGAAAFNTGIGYNALRSITTGTRNSAVGYNSLGITTTGSSNVANGTSVMVLNTTGSFNSVTGDQALNKNVSGNNNTINGYTAAYYVTGSNNTALGTGALDSVSGSGDINNNTFVGYFSGRMAQTGADSNTGVGYQSGYNISTGQYNTTLGYFTTTGGITTGSNNILIGQDVRYGLDGTASNQLNIGNLIYATGLGSGNTAGTGNVGIGTSSPYSSLSVAGQTVVGNLIATSTGTSLADLTLSGITGSTQCLHVDSSGAVSGTGSDCGSGSGGAAFAWTPGTQYGQTSNSTSTLIHFNGSPFSLSASSTAIFTYASATALTITGDTQLNTVTATAGTSTNFAVTGYATSSNAKVSNTLQVDGNVGIGEVPSSNVLLDLLTTSASHPRGIKITGNSASNYDLYSYVSGDAQIRFVTQLDGKMSWGSGSAVADVNLSRSAAGELTDSGNLIISGNSTTTYATTTSLFSNNIIAKVIEGQRNAEQFSGSDIGAQINAAYADLPSTGGTIYVPAGAYSFSTQIAITTADKPALLVCPPGGATILTYTGTGTSTKFNYGAGNVTTYDHYGAGIEGCSFTGPSKTGATTGIEVGGSNGAQGMIINDVRINFFGKGVETAANVWNFHMSNSFIQNNNQAVRIEPYSNSGENMVFDHNTFADCSTSAPDKCFYADHDATASLQLTNNAFDDGYFTQEAGNLNTVITGGHFEDPDPTNYHNANYITNNSTANITITGVQFYSDQTVAGSLPYEFIKNQGHMAIYNISSDLEHSISPNALVSNIGGSASLEVYGYHTNGTAYQSGISTTSVNFIVDSDNSKVGVGTSTPGTTFSIGSTANFGSTKSTIFSPITFSKLGTFSVGASSTALTASAFFQVPTAASFTNFLRGALAYDTTSGNLVMGTTTSVSSSQHVIVASATSTLYSFSIASTSPTLTSGGFLKLPADYRAAVATAVICQVTSGTSVVINLSNEAGSSDTNTITCTTTSNEYKLTSNNSYAAFAVPRLEIGTVTGSVDYLTLRVLGYRTSD